MRKIYLAFTLLFLAFIGTSLQGKNEDEGDCTLPGPRKSAGPPSCFAGEPPNNTNCAASGCHEDFAVNSGPALLNLYPGDITNDYTPGQNYTITVSLVRTGMVRGGFQLTALSDNDASTTPGTITLTDANRTQLINAANPHSDGCPVQNKTWIEHTTFGIDDVANDSLSWQFRWQAPATYRGSITFYVAALDANKDLDNTGDHVYTLTKTIGHNTTGIEPVAAEPEILVYPNPVSNWLYLGLPNGESGVIKLYDSQNKLIRSQNVQEVSTQKISLQNLPAGVYLLQYRSTNSSVVKKIVKQ